MSGITKQHAQRIAGKLHAEIDTSRRRHDYALVSHGGKLVVEFGIRRGSKKDLGHGHIASQLGLSQRDTLLLSQCSITEGEWVEMMKKKGII